MNFIITWKRQISRYFSCNVLEKRRVFISHEETDFISESDDDVVDVKTWFNTARQVGKFICIGTERMQSWPVFRKHGSLPYRAVIKLIAFAGA